MIVQEAPATPVPKLRAYAQELLARTRARAVNWVARERHGRPPETSYELVLPDARVTIGYTSPVLLEDYITLRLQNAGGVTVDEWRVEEPDYDPDIGETLDQADVTGDWRLMRELFGEVHREANGYDRVISGVEKALASLGVIGLPAPAPARP